MSQQQWMNPAELYEAFFGPAMFQPLARELTRFADVRPGERVLDLACGTGLAARAAAPLVGPAGSITAVDVNPAMLAVARRQPPPAGGAIAWREGDAVTLDVPPAAFDLALCQQGLQFFADPVEALRRVRGALVPGGRLVLAVWQGIERQSLFAELARLETSRLAPLGVSAEDAVVPFSLGDADRLRALLEEAGFVDVEIVERSIEARFAGPETFTRNMETAYGALIPAFIENPAAFEAFLEDMERATRELVRSYTVGDTVRFTLHTNLARAFAPAAAA